MLPALGPYIDDSCQGDHLIHRLVGDRAYLMAVSVPGPYFFDKIGPLP